MHRFRLLFAWCLALLLMAPLGPALAQSKLSNAQLDQLTAPVALYPDALVSQVLMAATYPADVAAAARWAKANPSLSGDAATKAVASQSWDPSVQSLAAFPSVLDMMGRQPQWVQSIGDAFAQVAAAVLSLGLPAMAQQAFRSRRGRRGAGRCHGAQRRRRAAAGAGQAIPVAGAAGHHRPGRYLCVSRRLGAPTMPCSPMASAAR